LVLLAILGMIAVVTRFVGRPEGPQDIAPSAAQLERAEKQRAVVEVIQRLRGSVRYDYQRDLEKGLYAPPPGPAALRERYGLDMVATVERVSFGPRTGADDILDDAGLREVDGPLRALPHLTSLDICGKGVTDAGLKHLAGLSQLKELSIYGTSITDSGLEQIQGLIQLVLSHV
jgi:hypothetical protein